VNVSPSYRIPLAKYPAIRIVLLFAGGIIIAFQLSFGIYVWLAVFGISVITWTMAEYFARRKLNVAFNYAAIGCYFMAIISFGSLWQTLFSSHYQPASARLLSSYAWKPIKVKGTIQNIGKSSSGKYHLDINVKTTWLEDSLKWKEPYTLRTIYDPQKKHLPRPAKIGDIIRFRATVYPLEGKRNPHIFDYKKFLASRGIYVQAGITKIYSIRQTNGWLSWLTWRRRALELIKKTFSPKTTPLAEAVLLGYKNDLPRGLKTGFSRVGLAHIMAVSGLHVGLLIAPFWLIIPFLWRFKYGRQFGFFLLVSMLFIYAGLTGFSPSVMRASITGGFLTYGRLFHRLRDSKNLTAAAAILILLINPEQLFSVSFQLSFAAVFSILLIIPVLQELLPVWLKTRWYGTLVMIMLLSTVVQAALYPLLSYYFGYFSFAGPLTNLAVLPLLTFILPYSLLLLPVAAFFPAGAFVLNAPCRWFFIYLQWIVTRVSRLSWSWVHTSPPGVFIFLIWVALICMIAALYHPRLRWKFFILILIILCTQQTYRLVQKLQRPLLKITMFDVGQGDAAFISTPSGKHFLIDTGRWRPGYNSANSIILPYLKAAGVHKLDAVFLSHPHSDHIGGMPAVITHIPIDTIYNSGYSYHSELYRRYLRLAQKHHIPVKSLSAGDRVLLDPAMRIFIYGPSPFNHFTDANQHSLIIELIYGKKRFLFVGDAGKPEDELLLNHYGPMLNTDFLKVGHHGSKTSSYITFLKTATPNIEAVSLAFHNKYHFPSPQAVQHLKATHAKIYYTSRSGALVFYSNGTYIKRKKWQ
jgi:competence protein ComEC